MTEPTAPAQPLKTCRLLMRTSVPSAWLASTLVGCNNTSVFLWGAEPPPTSAHEVQPQIKGLHYSLISDRSHMTQAWPIQASLFPDSSDAGTSTQSTVTNETQPHSFAVGTNGKKGSSLFIVVTEMTGSILSASDKETTVERAEVGDREGIIPNIIFGAPGSSHA